MRWFITGTAGFIGFHLARRLLAEGHTVIGYDAMTDYYDPALKAARHAVLGRTNAFTATVDWLEDHERLRRAMEDAAPDVIVHLAGQAGVRHSIDNPRAYVDANLVGSFNVVDIAKDLAPRHLLLASTSSVYGGNETMPFREVDRTDWPVSLYAATKKAMEAMSHSHAHLFGVPTTCFRFFTVYGPWGRPDMAYFIFTRSIVEGRPIQIFNEGRMRRDFTYIDDIVEGVRRIMEKPPAGNPDWSGDAPDPATSRAPHVVYNIGNNQPVELMRMIEALENALGMKARKVMLPMQPGDVPATYADVADLEREVGFRPDTSIEDGLGRFVQWYRREWNG